MSLMENGGMSAADMAAVLGNNRANNDPWLTLPNPVMNRKKFSR